MSISVLSDCLYLGATGYDENYNVIPLGDGWKICLGQTLDGRASLKFIYVASDLSETVCDELDPPTI